MTERGDCWQRRYKAAAAPPALAEKRAGKGRDCAAAGSLPCAVAERLNSRERGRIGIVTGQSSPSTPPGKGKRKRREPCGEKGLPHAVVARWAEVIGGDAARRLPHCLSPRRGEVEKNRRHAGGEPLHPVAEQRENRAGKDWRRRKATAPPSPLPRKGGDGGAVWGRRARLTKWPSSRAIRSGSYWRRRRRTAAAPPASRRAVRRGRGVLSPV